MLVCVWVIAGLCVAVCAAGGGDSQRSAPIAGDGDKPDADGVRWARVEPGLWREGAGALPSMDFALVLPSDFDPGKDYPVVVVLPPGEQDRQMVGAGLTYFKAEAQRQGWVIVSPVAAKGSTLVESSGAAIERLFWEIARRVRIESGVLHVAGVSNGGRAAFHWAAAAPGRFASVLVLPGFAEDADLAHAERLKEMPVSMFVGQKDSGWVSRGEKTRDALKSAGVRVEWQSLPNEDHVLKGLNGRKLLEVLERSRAGARSDRGPHSRGQPSMAGAALQNAALAGAVLDCLHERASKADEEGYFALFDESAVFLGTDATERWSPEQFRAYAHPAFSKGKGWTYHPVARHLATAEGDACVWFDEDLDHDRYGRCRGSGVLVARERNGRRVWLVAQYNLSVPIPNDHLVNAVGLWRRASAAPSSSATSSSSPASTGR